MDRSGLSGKEYRQYCGHGFCSSNYFGVPFPCSSIQQLVNAFCSITYCTNGLLSAIVGVWVTGSDNNIFTQIGFVVLVGLAAKNAILIVEFARAKEDEGLNPFDAVLEAARLRLRPILMTSIAFIAGVIPLVLATGAGAEMRHAMGIAVFSGMLGVTIFGLLFTPIFYVVIRNFILRREQ